MSQERATNIFTADALMPIASNIKLVKPEEAPKSFADLLDPKWAGKQKVLQVQSSTEPPKKLALGERAVSADGLEYVHIQLKESGAPIEIVYPKEGTPFIPSCEGIAKNAPHPNAAKLFIIFMTSRETQQYLVD